MANFLKDFFFGVLVSVVYCAVFIFVARQFGVTIEDYAIWMGISVGVIPFILKKVERILP